MLLLPAQVAWNWYTPHPDVPQGRPRPQSFDAAHWFHLLDPPGFAIGYGEWLRNPLWVSWEVPAGALQPLTERPRNFRCARETWVEVCPDDYRNSGFDRGHLAPNYAMSRLFGRPAQLASFSMANITPQKHAMNSRAWQRLEEAEMEYLRPTHGQRFWVMAGPLFASSPPRLPSGIAIPEASWRIWVRQIGGPADPALGDWQVLAFIVPQEANGFEDLRQFLVSVDQVEQRSGFDLLHRLPDVIENAIEASVDPEHWQLGEAWTRPPRY